MQAEGVETLPAALLAAGLDERLGARRAGGLPAPDYDPRIDTETGVLNPGGLRDYSARLADFVGAVLDCGEFPIVLGGDCSILLGAALALRRRGRHGLLFLDGHADYYQPATDPTGEAASMDLALVTGHGPDIVTNLEGRRPLVREEDVVAFAFRDAELAAAEGSQPLPPDLRAMDLRAVREQGVERAAREALAHLEREGGPAGFWIHLDADVLDDAIMPAVDYRLPDGLSWDELSVVLRAAVARPRGRSRDHDLQSDARPRQPDRARIRRRARGWAFSVSSDLLCLPRRTRVRTPRADVGSQGLNGSPDSGRPVAVPPHRDSTIAVPLCLRTSSSSYSQAGGERLRQVGRPRPCDPHV